MTEAYEINSQSRAAAKMEDGNRMEHDGARC